MNKGILYYTDSRLDEKYAAPVIRQIEKMNLPTLFVSLKRNPFVKNQGNCIILDGWEPGYMTMFDQIRLGLVDMNVDVVFLAEHDVLYHPSHFDFVPEREDTFYYNQNVWKVRASDGHALHYPCSQVSGLCAYRDLLYEHYSNRLTYIVKNGYSNKLIRKIGFEPGTHNRVPELSGKSETWMSEYPNIDIRHDNNLTKSRWNKEQFRNQKYTKGWTESESIPYWGTIQGRFDDIMNMI